MGKKEKKDLGHIKDPESKVRMVSETGRVKTAARDNGNEALKQGAMHAAAPHVSFWMDWSGQAWER